MATYRAVQKGISTSERFVTLEEWEQLLFIQLLVHTDDWGRLPGSPLQVKLMCCPASARSTGEIMGALSKMADPAHCLIRWYEAEGRRWVQVLEFDQTQPKNLIGKRTASKFPPPSANFVELPGNSTLDVDVDLEERRSDVEVSKVTPCSSPAVAVDVPKVPECPHQEILEAYHDMLPELCQVRSWTDHRQALLRSRWREDPKRQTVEWWRTFFTWVRKSDFLMGRGPGRNGEPPFQADLEWLIRPRNFAKLRDGKYHHDRRGMTKQEWNIGRMLAEIEAEEAAEKGEVQ